MQPKDFLAFAVFNLGNCKGNEKICRNISRKLSLYARLMSYKSMNFSK